jgi:hypothetical protein
MRLLVTDAAAQPPRQATAWLIMTLGRNMNTEHAGEALVLLGLLSVIPTVLVTDHANACSAPSIRAAHLSR